MGPIQSHSDIYIYRLISISLSRTSSNFFYHLNIKKSKISLVYSVIEFIQQLRRRKGSEELFIKMNYKVHLIYFIFVFLRNSKHAFFLLNLTLLNKTTIWS
jgi:hypothetical protein